MTGNEPGQPAPQRFSPEDQTPMADASRPEPAPQDDDRHRLLVDAITRYAVCSLDPEGRVTSWNRGARLIAGYEASEVIGQSFAALYADEDRQKDAPRADLRAAIAHGRFEAEGWRVRKGGERFWAHMDLDPILAPDGAVIGFALVIRDLTDRRTAEASLRASEDQFRRLVQGVTDYAIYMLDAEGRLTNWNAGAQRIKGYLPEEVVGRHFSQFYTPEDRAAGIPALGLETARRLGRWEQEGWRVRKDGSRFWAHVVIDAIHDDLGAVIGFAKVTRDITERMQAQKALDEAREALYLSSKLDAIGQLTGGIAHDFNNLLMAVLGSLELVRKRLPDDARITPLLDNAIQGARRGAILTQRMLAFARKQDLQFEAVDVAALAANLRSLLEPAVGPDIRIEMRIPAGLPRVRTDANQLESALLNLAVNARDAMPAGGTITLTAQTETVTNDPALHPGDYVRLCLSDPGEGMDEATVARAADPFFTTKGVGRGTGLGLSMVHGLAAQSGGALKIDSQPGVGTSVCLWLPSASEPANINNAAPAPAPSPGSADDPLVILAVDDDELVLLNTAALLEDLGHVVLQAACGSEAMDLLRLRADIELVITDYAMPVMTGAQLAEQARRQRPGLPVIVATGYAELPSDGPSDLRRLAKPFTQQELQAAVTQAMDDRRAGSSGFS